MKNFTTTEDGRHIIVEGRKWRATDPSIPEPLKAQLVSVLMKGRRNVAKALRSKDSDLEKAARVYVSDAKIALGERGAVWWEPYKAEDLQQRIQSSILTLLRHREDDKSICPSEAARIVGTPDTWRELMPTVRDVAIRLAHQGMVEITRGDELLAPDHLGKGPIRIRRGTLFPDLHV